MLRLLAGSCRMSDAQSLARDVTALTELANRFSQNGRPEEASELLLLALRLDPKNLSVKLSLAEARSQQRLQGGGPSRSVKETLREGLRRNAIDAAHFLGLAHLYAEKGENARATECIEIAKAKSLATPSTHKLHGRLLFRRKELDNAADELAQALRYNPFDREVSELLGRTEYERKQYEAALRATVHAFLLLNEGDEEGVARLRRRIQTLKQILGWGNRELGQVFRERQDHLRIAFDRLEWHRERFLEESGLAAFDTAQVHATAPQRAGRGPLDMAARLRRQKPWAHLSDEQVFALTAAVTEQVHDAGDLVFAHQSPGGDLYLLESGEVSLQRTTGYGTFLLGSVLPGELFGEAGFVARHDHAADAVALAPCQVLRLDAEALAPLLEEAPDLGVQLYWTLWHSLARKLRATNDQLGSFFSTEVTPESFVRLRKQPAGGGGSAIKVEETDKIRLFREQGISRKELATLTAFSREKRFAAGASLFQEGDAGTEMYVILDGRALISKYIPGAGEEALAILERGDFFGEMALID
ncbi:MAG TPA: hypothetical protein DD490_05435, partial [Acidobacteria bacterium]|nr:hypothetical protein [Acidobacteriota bacterium]